MTSFNESKDEGEYLEKDELDELPYTECKKCEGIGCKYCDYEGIVKKEDKLKEELNEF